MPGRFVEPEGGLSPRGPVGMSIDESGPAPPQAENVGILAAEVYFPTTYVGHETSRGPARGGCVSIVSRRAHPDLVWPTGATVDPAAPLPFRGAQVRQEDLEKHDGVPSGKYTIGLGQVRGVVSWEGERRVLFNIAAGCLPDWSAIALPHLAFEPRNPSSVPHLPCQHGPCPDLAPLSLRSRISSLPGELRPPPPPTPPLRSKACPSAATARTPCQWA